MKIKFFYHPTLICINPPVLSIPDLLCFENHSESIKNRDLNSHPLFSVRVPKTFPYLKLKIQQSELQNKHAEWSFFECLFLKLLPPIH